MHDVLLIQERLEMVGELALAVDGDQNILLDAVGEADVTS